MARDREQEEERSNGGPRPDLEGVDSTFEDVGSLPVPRSVRESKGEEVGKAEGSAFDEERGLLPGARRPRGAPKAEQPARRGSAAISREDEARLRRTLPIAARTPEQLGSALNHQGTSGLRDPQGGKEGGPPRPGLDPEGA